jgi:hypothetical protein
MASDPPRNLTKPEFEQLLQRAVERDNLTERRDFSEAELIAAGRELGIDEATVRGVLVEHARALALPELQPRPFDSKLTLTKRSDLFCLSIPPVLVTQLQAGLRSLLAAAGFVFVAANVHGWLTPTTGVISAGIIYLSVRSAVTRRELRLARDGGGLLARFVGQRGRGITLHAGQVRARLHQRMTSNKQGGQYTEVLALDHGTETYELLENYSHAEREWAVAEIERWLGR